ncbi:MarR family winged helix-turn-helix transcriptional regulator [Candidatus Leptofilum sp.]|uniref:MarR family winged helix-turn-helix transcriptional regulator n=1 Tax=Candidatus Leptofilum sp. TaxID=3241576 RepID=UPI003B5A727B
MAKKTFLHDKEKRQRWMAFVQNFHPDIDPQTIRLMDEMGFVARLLHHLREQSIEAAGLSFAQYGVLMHLFFAEQMSEKTELNPSEISERQGVSRNTMSSFIRNLEDEALIERRLDPKDRRRFNISLTENGRSLVAAHMHDHLDAMDTCFSGLSPDEQDTLFALLQKLGTHVEAVGRETVVSGQ